MFDYVVIGGGVVGVAVFNKLVLSGLNCALIEKEQDLATGCSKANTGLVHAGFDAMPGTLKARLNVQGAKMFPRVCSRLGIKYKKTGAIVVGDNLEKINELYQRGKTNGVKKLKILNKKQTQKLCPNIKNHCEYALFAPTAGVVSPYLLTIALCEEAVINGGKVFLDYNIEKIEKEQTFKIFGKEIVESKNIINASGFGFNEVSRLIGTEIYDLKFRRGQYYVLDKEEDKFVNLSVFPLPTILGKGIVASPTIDGNVLLGPTAEEGENNTNVTDLGLEQIRKNIEDMFGYFPKAKAIREFSGVRCSCGEDFKIEKSKLVDGVINIVGINSPGLTASLAIAEYVLGFCGGISPIRAKKRTPYINMSDLTKKQKNKLIKRNEDFGKIICRCEKISLGEIKQVLVSPISPTTLDGIKRRIRAGMGRCQGSFCASRILQILSSFHQTRITDICKEKTGSKVVPYEVKQYGGQDE